MNKYLPYAGTNAIQEAVIGVHFRNDLSLSDIKQARTVADAKLNNEFPRSENIFEEQLKIEYINQKPSLIEDNSSHLSGFRLIKIGSDGKPKKALRMARNLLTIHFMKYEDWISTRSKSLQYVSTILPKIDLEVNALQAFSLRYIDRFTFDGSPNDARASLLMKEMNSYVTKKCFDAGSLWHCNSGWFVEFGSKSHALSQLNISSAMVEGAPTITIDHNMICQMKRPHNTMESFLDSAGGEGIGLEDSLNDLHEINRDFLSDILLSEVSQEIGLLS